MMAPGPRVEDVMAALGITSKATLIDNPETSEQL